jgi:autotransporter family porin
MFCVINAVCAKCVWNLYGKWGPNGIHSWSELLGQYSNKGKRHGVAGYNATTYGISMGADKQFTHDLLLGAAITYSNILLNVDGTPGSKTNINSFMFSGYGGYEITPKITLTGQLSYALGYNTESRYILGNDAAKSDYFTHQILAQTELGYDFQITDNMIITPLMINDISYYHNGGYSESGSAYDINFGSTNLLSYNIGGGIRYLWEIALSETSSLRPNVFLGYTIDILNPSLTTTGESNGAVFNIEGQTQDRNAFFGNLGLHYQVSESIEFRAEYNITARDKYTSQGGTLEGSYFFELS